MSYENEFENTSNAPETAAASESASPAADAASSAEIGMDEAIEMLANKAQEAKNDLDGINAEGYSENAASENAAISEEVPSEEPAPTPEEPASVNTGNVYAGNPGAGMNYGAPYNAQNGAYGQPPYAGAYNGAPYGTGAQGGMSYGDPNVQNVQNGAVGIRYNADGTRNDGSYTWNYCNPGAAAPAPTPKKKNGKKGLVVLAAAASLVLVAGLATCAAIFTKNVIVRNNAPVSGTADGESEEEPTLPFAGFGEKKTDDTKPVVSVPLPGSDNGNALTKQQIAVKCKPSYVGIQIETTTRSFFGEVYRSTGVGSGFIITEDGYIATNNHVVEGAETITVMMDDGTKYEAELVGADAITDLAVVKIDVTGLVPMEIGDSDRMVVGDSVIAIGTPAGIEFAGTVTDGIVSAINRDVEITDNYGRVVKTMTLMQTNAAINPGNSGGPLINDKGQVIGINTLKLNSQYEGIGFSIPINSAVKIFNQLMKDGKVTEYDGAFVTGNGAIGITQYEEITEDVAEYYNIPEGIMVIQINKNSAAVAAGLRRGDIIIGYNGTTVRTVDELNRAKSKNKAGDEVTLRIFRDGVGESDITFKLDMMQ